MKREGPPLELLTRRLSETPEDFLAEPIAGSKGLIDVAAVVSDLLRDLGGSLLTADRAETFSEGDKRRLTMVLIASWVLHDKVFTDDAGVHAEAAYRFLSSGLDRLVGVVEPKHFVSDPDRREELARLVLRGLDLRPSGESAKQATDRLGTLDSVERIRVLRDTRAAQERIRQIQEAMKKKAAEEAAASYGRE